MKRGMQKKKKKPLLISMKMNKLVVSQRIAGIHARKPFGHIKGGPDLFRREQLVERMKGIEQAEVPFDIVYGKLSSNVESIYAMARQLKPECIYIDGAYLLSHPKERDRYIRVAENATLIKKELASLCPVVCSWQLSREAAKKKVKDVGLEDIGYSDAIGQLSSLVLSLSKENS